MNKISLLSKIKILFKRNQKLQDDNFSYIKGRFTSRKNMIENSNKYRNHN
ncbi:hypothetical protein UFOVP1491_150 [uncultured Caudovirales phage]|uniref:Uncharacterized protein n=1 Tax=uncultured Caudovirales phage TaxID=2100421 RepID=A0A6J5QWS9_9CAUD|nr:hypothetical protein UFOVP485_123 [uncultured Caudovirales phage]CAB4150964.1 hypothetical protein UFOVP575_75 [uncultured Caudovirales phage]CAB4174822.1 hypothetical protein UFOVP963_85 [uncultured Caudovirales phage]CAB4179890.1 hypothetical protein UFOVP1032_150 [uncultured Caudovirales phage]CAB4185575.1 hypothetical protein UFOVP1125_66 [uncultured Caudovirales phage]